VGQRRRNPSQQDRYLYTVLDIERKGLIDEKTASIIKTLILEENIDVYQKLNEFSVH